MYKNISGQAIGAQMITAADGSAFTGTVTVYVTGNNGTQALGSVGSGICTHKGGGYHSYAPAMAETNYNHVAYTFIGTGAVPVTVQVYPRDLALMGIHATGTLSGTHSSTTADLGANAPSTDISKMSLYIRGKGFLRIVDAYNTGTGVATFETTSITLEDGDEWVLMATPAASDADPASVRVVDMSPAGAQALLTAQMVESYSADGVAPTLAQALMLIMQVLTDSSISGTSMSIRGLDGSTTVATLTLNHATTPTSVTRTA